MIKQKSSKKDYLDNKNKNDNNYEIIKIKKTKNICPVCEDFSKKENSKIIAVLCCEGACLRGEIARRAANIICHKLAKEKTVRICLGGAFTKDTGQRNLVKKAKKIVVIEGCFINCASRMMNGVIKNFKPMIIIADNLYDLKGNIFGINEMSEKEIKTIAGEVAKKVLKKI